MLNIRSSKLLNLGNSDSVKNYKKNYQLGYRYFQN